MAMSSRGWKKHRRSFSWSRTLRSLGDPRSVRLVVILLLALLALRIVQAGYHFRNALNGFSSVGLNADRSDVLYGIGAPREVAAANGPWRPAVTQADQAAERWAYVNAGAGRVEVHFDPADQRVDEIRCSQPQALPGSCEPLFGVGVGADEDRLTFKLGDASREQLSGDTKVMRYDDLGAEYHLKQYVIFEARALRRRGGFVARLSRFARSLVP